MKNIKNTFFVTLTLLILSGCAGHPKIITFTPASIVIDYGDSNLYEATRVAQQYCDSLKKDAQYVRTESSWFSGAKEGFFNCIESMTKTGAGAGYGNSPIINNVVPSNNNNVTPPVINNNNR